MPSLISFYGLVVQTLTTLPYKVYRNCSIVGVFQADNFLALPYRGEITISRSYLIPRGPISRNSCSSSQVMPLTGKIASLVIGIFCSIELGVACIKLTYLSLKWQGSTLVNQRGFSVFKANVSSQIGTAMTNHGHSSSYANASCTPIISFVMLK